jgi:hypothetical protein
MYADLEVALNYGQSVGFAQMVRFVTEHTEVYLLLSTEQCGQLTGLDYS